MYLADDIRLSIKVDKPAFVVLINVATDGKTYILLPNKYMPAGQKVEAGASYEFPPPGLRNEKGERVYLRVKPPVGLDMLVAIATTKPLDLSSFESETLPSLANARSLRGSSPVQLASRLRNLVLEAAGTDAGWGVSTLLLNVRQR